VIEEGCGVLRVRLGGRLRLDAGGVELPPPVSRRARRVLAYLALHPGPHARAELDARFWPDVLDESARTSLRAALSELRRALGPAADHVVATRDTVALDGDDLTVDPAEAVRLSPSRSTPRRAARARRSRPAGRAPRAGRRSARRAGRRRSR
jgi:DNA-binding SARP family transcriptional activator